jgi:hypothetical protein
MMKALEDITKMIVLAESMLESPVPVVNYAQLRRDYCTNALRRKPKSQLDVLPRHSIGLPCR